MNICILPRTPCRPSDHLSYLFFASSDPLYRYRLDPLPDFRRTPGGWGGGNPPPPAPTYGTIRRNPKGLPVANPPSFPGIFE